MVDSRHKRRAAGLIALLLLAACGGQDEPELRGGLYFASGNYLAQLDLRDGSTSVVTNLGDAEIREISPQSAERLLLTVFGNVNQQDTHRLVLYDIETRQTLTLLNGRYGRYLPDSQVLVYDDGTRILVAEKILGTWEKTEVATHRFNAPLRILPISATRFLYALAGEPIHAYDNVSKRSIRLDRLTALCDLDHALWMPERDALLCRSAGADDQYTYPLVDLDGTVQATLPLPASRSLQPLAALPDQGVLVLAEQWRGRMSGRRRSAVWIYRFADEHLYRLLDDQHLGRWVVYTSAP